MEITIRLLAGYRRYSPYDLNGRGSFPQLVPPGATVGHVLSTLPIPPGEALAFLVNGRHAERNRSLQAGDVLTIFPAAGGG